MAYRDIVLSDSPVDYYEMETSTGTDSGSGARTLTLSGGVTTGAAGKVGNAWSFDGVNDYASMATWPSLTTAFSFEAWVKPSLSGVNDTPTVVRRDGTDIHLLRVRGSSVAVNPGQAEVYADGLTLLSGSSFRVDDGNWHHLVYTQSGNSAKLYVDGVERASGTTGQSTFNMGTGAGYIGAANGSTEFYKGLMDEVAVYNTALSAARVTAHFDAVNTRIDVTTQTASSAANDVTVETNVMTSTATASYDGAWDTNDKSLSQADTETSASGTSISVSASSPTDSNDTYAKIQFSRSDIAPAFSPIVFARATIPIVDRETSSHGSTSPGVSTSIQVYSRTGSTYTQQATATVTSDPTTVVVDLTSALQYAFAQNLSTFEIRIFTDYTGFMQIGTNEGGAPVTLATGYTQATVGVTVDADVPAASTDVVALTGIAGSAVFDASSLTASAATVEPTTEAQQKMDADTLTVSALANDVTVESSTSPDAVMDVATVAASAQAQDVAVVINLFADADTASAAAAASDVSIETTAGVLEDLDTPAILLTIVKPADVNGEPIVPTETEDPYFVSTLRTIDNGDVWWRLNEASGTKVYNRANPTSEWPGTGTGTYSNVVIGQFDGPESRRSVYFNGTSWIEENEPTASNLDEVFYSPNTLEFTFRTERGTQFIMGGADNNGAPGTGISSPVEASEFWLVDGKINFRAYRLQGANVSPQVTTDITGFTNLADGKWHHIVVNAGITNAARGSRAIEIYIDGQLEIRRFAGVQGTSANETVETAVVWFGMPDYIGGRPELVDQRRLPALSQSQWFVGDMTEVVFRNQKVLSEDQIHLQRDNMFGIIPIYAEAARISTKTDDATVKGNKVRVLVIDFQTSASMQVNQSYNGVGPQPGHDVNGRLITAPPYTAAYQFPTLTFALADNSYLDEYQYFRVPVRNNYLDPVTDNERILNLDTDIDIEDYDILAIGGYPLNDGDWSWYTGMDEYSTAPFIPGKNQVENLMAQIRQKAIEGKRLFVNDPGSAVALGIVDRVEYVPTMRERAFNDARVGSTTGLYDDRATDVDPWGFGQSPDRYRDEHANQMQRIRKTIDGLTTLPSYLITDYFEWYASDPMSTPPMQSAKRYADRTNGLLIGDEFYLNGAVGPGILDAYDEQVSGAPSTGSRATGWLAAPMANVKVGSVVTSFGGVVYNKDKADVNPFKDYAVSIVVQPGDTWNGQAVQGKVYVNFTEAWTHWAGFYEEHQKQVKPETGDPVHPQTPEQDAWDWSTYRGEWTGTTVNSHNSTSGGGQIETKNGSGNVSGPPRGNTGMQDGGGTTYPETGSGRTVNPNRVSLVTFTWQSWWPQVYVPVLSMAYRGLKWLGFDVEHDGNATVSLETAEANATALDVTVQTKASVEIDLSTARVSTEAFEDADTTAADATALVQTATAVAKPGPFIEAVDLTTATATTKIVEADLDPLEGLEIVRLVLPRHAVTLILEEA